MKFAMECGITVINGRIDPDMGIEDPVITGELQWTNEDLADVDWIEGIKSDPDFPKLDGRYHVFAWGDFSWDYYMTLRVSRIVFWSMISLPDFCELPVERR